MRRTWLWEFAVLAVIATLTLLLLAWTLPGRGNAHLAFCGHYTKIYNNGLSAARYDGWQLRDGYHQHRYEHWNRLPSGSWVKVHSYWRICPRH